RKGKSSIWNKDFLKSTKSKTYLQNLPRVADNPIDCSKNPQPVPAASPLCTAQPSDVKWVGIPRVSSAQVHFERGLNSLIDLEKLFHEHPWHQRLKPAARILLPLANASTWPNTFPQQFWPRSDAG